MIILPSPLKKAETFIQALHRNLHNTADLEYEFFYPGYKLNRRKAKHLFLILVNLGSIINFIKINSKQSLLKKLVKTYAFLEILSETDVKCVHFLFSNLSVGNCSIAEQLGAKLSIGFRGYDITYFPVNHPNCYAESYWNKIDSIQSNSLDLYRWGLRWGAEKHTPFTIINSAVDDEFILTPDKINVSEVLSPIKLVFVGRLHWKKGIDTLLRVVFELSKTCNVFIEIIGDGPEREKIKFIVEKFGLADRVSLRGKLTQPDILNCFDKCDILLAPSIQEGCSNVVLEAQARGLYCIVSNAEGMNEVIENNTTGVICDMWDDKSWIQEVIAYSELSYNDRLEKSRYTVDRISREFTRSKQVMQWNNYFRKLCLTS